LERTTTLDGLWEIQSCIFPPSYLSLKPYYYKQYHFNSLITCNFCSCWARMSSELASATNLPRPPPQPHPLGCLWPAFIVPLCWPPAWSSPRTSATSSRGLWLWTGSSIQSNIFFWRCILK
jgi:hypothetical protein